MRAVIKKNTSIKIFFKPRKNKIETLLRPPYRHKISRHQITLSRYYLLISFNTKLSNNLMLCNLQQLIFIVKEISKDFRYFETNICYTHSIRVKINFFYKNFFKLMNYKK